MKQTILVLGLALLVLGSVSGAGAALWNRGSGMIYDDVLGVTWLQNVNYARTSGYDSDGLMTQAQASAWAAGLVYAGFDDWRLPTVRPLNGTTFNFAWSYNGSTDSGYNIMGTHSELMYMYYVNLRNTSNYDQYGNPIGGNWGLQNKGPFSNLVSGIYWIDAAIVYPGNTLLAINFVGGSQTGMSAGTGGYAWAVRDGDVAAVPLPPAFLLLGSALAACIALKRKLRVLN